jgi:S1-C subfamily serine protease
MRKLFAAASGSMAKALIAPVLAVFPLFALAQPTAPAPDAQAIFARTRAATVIVLAGEGAGRVTSIATGVVISKDGVILTALHAVKGAAEVQVRMANGDIFDRVQLLGFDERRDVAALKIPAGALPALVAGSTASLAQGDPVYAVTNAGGLAWSATAGIVSAVRPADEVRGAGSGFRLLQFTAPVAPGSSGGALVDGSGELIGIITGGKGSAAFAVPIENLSGLAETDRRADFGSGESLQMPAQEAAAVPQTSAAIATADPGAILRNAKTIYISSDTMFLTVETMERALLQQKDWNKLGLRVVADPKLADLSLHIDRLVFTHIHTYDLTDNRTSIVLASGRKTAFDGVTASPDIADRIVGIIADARLPEPAKKQ